jgi:hypothetical protein
MRPFVALNHERRRHIGRLIRVTTSKEATGRTRRPGRGALSRSLVEFQHEESPPSQHVMRRVERPDLRIRGTYVAPSAISACARLVLKKLEIIGNLRAIRLSSNTMRRQLGAFANSSAIACAVDAVLLS